MSFISKFKDYYDGLAERGKGDHLTRVYVREEKDIEVYEQVLTELEERSKYMFLIGGTVRPIYLIIAGKVYPFLEDWKISSWDDPNAKRFMYAPSDVEKKRQNYFRKHYRERERRDFFGEYSDMTQLCLQLNTPIILVCPRSPNYQAGKDRPYRNVAINVKLSKWGFHQVMSAPEIYQVLDTFVSNVLVKDQMPPTPQTDIEKVEAHGFDKKTSFRNVK